jgi:hypothetical protein
MANACARAAEIFYGDEVFDTKDITVALAAPGVKMKIARTGAQSKVGDLLAEQTDQAVTPVFWTIRCSFSDATAPFGLVEFCPPETCFFVTPVQLAAIQQQLADEGL